MTANEAELRALMRASLAGDAAAHRALLSRLSANLRAYLISINNSRRLVWYQKQVALLQLAEPTFSRTPLELPVISLRLLPRWRQERAGQRTEHEICSPEVGATRTNMKRGIAPGVGGHLRRADDEKPQAEI